MLTKERWHNIVIAYRLEDDNGNSPFYVSSNNTHFPSNVLPDIGEWFCAFCNPCKYLESPYNKYLNSFDIYEYLLHSNIHIGIHGEVNFRTKDVISKSIIRRAALCPQS